MTSGPAAALVLCGVDDQLARQLTGLAGEASLAIVRDTPAAGTAGGPAPAAVVVALDRPGAVDEVRRWRDDHPGAVVAAYLALPDRATWEAAERAGADLVVNRGALVRSLRRLLAGIGPGPTARRRFALFDAAEVAGRLGLVQVVEETPVGPLAVYRHGSGLVGLCDVCPHAGARLSGGAVEGGVVTCPAHGSRFEMATGERVRGPADQGIATYTVVQEEGRVWLVWI